MVIAPSSPGARDHRHHHRLAELAAEAGDGGAEHLGLGVGRQRVPTGGEAVDERGQRDDGGDVGAAGRGGDDVATGERDAPEHEPLRVDPGQPRGGRHRGAVVLELAGHRDGLPRRTGRWRRSRGSRRRGRRARRAASASAKGSQPGVLGARQPVGHHDDRPTGVGREGVALTGEVPGVALDAAGDEGERQSCFMRSSRRCWPARCGRRPRRARPSRSRPARGPAAPGSGR